MRQSDDDLEAKVPKTFIFISLLFSIWALFHTIKTRSFDDIVKNSLYVIGVVLSICIVLILIVFIKKGISKPRPFDFFSFIFIITILFIIGPLYYSFGVSLKDLYLWIKSPNISKNGVITLTLIITLVLGVGLFLFRLYARSIYGLTEAVVGLTVAANKASSENVESLVSSNFYLAVLTASVYLIVRGLDNIHQGLIKEPIDPYGLRLMSFLKNRF